MFIDTHCHIEEDKENYINNSINSNVNIMINASVNLDTSLESIKLSNTYPGVYSCIGVHPENINEYDEDINKFRELLKEDKVVGIGEIGLDYYYESDNRDKQIEVFKEFLSLAKENNLPVVIHSRNATDDLLRILKEYKVRGIVHCFSGSVETAKELIKLGMYLGIGGVVTFKNSKLIDVIREIKLDHIVLETDSPYLAPEPVRGSKNESKNIPLIAKYLSDNLGISIEEVADITSKNALRVFDKIK